MKSDLLRLHGSSAYFLCNQEMRIMVGENLHKYDLALCDYVVGNIQQHLGEPAFAAYLAEQMERSMLNYIKAGVDPDIDQAGLLLNDGGIDDLSSTFHVWEPQSFRYWEPATALYRRHVDTLKEIRDALSKPA